MTGEPALFVVCDSFADELKVAMESAGKFLSVRPRTEHEIRERLRGTDHSAAVIDQTVARLVELGLLDDLEFARQWVSERAARKRLGPRALRAELTAKGVTREVVDEAIQAEMVDEEGLAVDAASRWVRKVARLPLAEQAHKLQQMLLRKGFSLEAAEAGAKAVLPPEGWD